MKRNWVRVCCRLLLLIALLTSGAAIVTGGILGLRALDGWMRKAPEFQLREITVYGNDLVGTDELVMLSGFAPGTNIFATDLRLGTARLMRDARLSDVFIRREYPSRVAIHVQEKQPIAYIQLDQLYGLDVDARLIPVTTSERLPDLPIITGCTALDPATLSAGATDGFEVEGELQLSVVQAIYIVEKLGAHSQQILNGISEIHMARRDDPILFTVGDAMAIRLGVGRLDEKLYRLKQLMSRLQQEGIKTPTVDLRFKDRAIIQPMVTDLVTEMESTRTQENEDNRG